MKQTRQLTGTSPRISWIHYPIWYLLTVCFVSSSRPDCAFCFLTYILLSCRRRPCWQLSLVCARDHGLSQQSGICPWLARHWFNAWIIFDQVSCVLLVIKFRGHPTRDCCVVYGQPLLSVCATKGLVIMACLGGLCLHRSIFRYLIGYG